MKTENIKPIPNYILQRIQKLDKRLYGDNNGYPRFYSYLAKNDKELVLIIVAVKTYRQRWLCKQVIIHGIHSEDCFIKDICLYYNSSYSIGWHDLGIDNKPKEYEDAQWWLVADKYYNPYAPIVNKEYLGRTEYKYSGYQHYTETKILKMLRLYEQYPQVELLLKMKLPFLSTSKQILKLTEKDTGFRRWLYINKDRLIKKFYHIPTVIEAYKTGKDIDEVHQFYRDKHELLSDNHLKEVVQMFKGELPKFIQYLKTQKISATLYRDYMVACNHLGLDMTLPKNRYPHDFKRWHDIRINEYAEAKARENAEKEAKLYTDFGLVANKYRSLELKHKVYMVVIPNSPADLVREGEFLHHCVGRMGYAQKMVNEDSLILFVRDITSPDIPLVTMEYCPKTKKVLQSYSDHNSRPTDAILNFIHRVWLPKANKHIKAMTA